MNRDFEYKGIKFHLNNNNGDKYYESKYDLMFWTGYTGWHKLCTVETKTEAKLYIKEHIYEIAERADYDYIASKPTCNWGGIVIIDCNDEYVESAELYATGLLRKAKAKVRYNAKGDAYFMRQGRREYLNEYMKVS